MLVDPKDYLEIPSNRHGIAAGAVLLPTKAPIVQGGSSSLDFVKEQGGDEDTFIFLFGMREVSGLYGKTIRILEGIFLSESGPGFYPTWGHEQLLRETDNGGWTVIPTEQVLLEWTERIEERINRG
jgi:hypothetical protein